MGETVWSCVGCKREQKTKGDKHPPKGWKRRGDDLFCKACWRERYILRAVTLPVAKPLDIEWTELRTVMQAMWAATTQASNWILTELYVRDARRTDQVKLPPMASQYLYPEIGKLFPQLPPQTRVALEQTVRQKYMAKRIDVIWRSSASLPTYRYPTPFPVHNQSWSIEMDGTAAVVSPRIGEGRVRLLLRSGVRYRRQYASIAQIISGDATRGEMAIYRQGKDLMCKMVAWLPRTAHPTERTGTLTVRTTADSLIVAFNLKDEKLWTYNGDQVRRWVAEHRKQLNRWSEDQKAETRPVPPFAQRREDAAVKHRHRMASQCHQLAAMIVNYAARRKFATIFYDDTDHSFVEEFPWFELAAKIAEKADAAGIELIHTSGNDASDEAGPK